ncbi:hypothetical protein QUF70_05125 [Desulfobacterales bacterium HSG17]|nr:hypothetical protein [Desulfobacterales bacterium HSG17]
MDEELTPEKLIEYGKQFENIYISGLESEKVMSRFSVKDRLIGLKPKDRLEGLKPEEIDELEKYLQELKKRK